MLHPGNLKRHAVAHTYGSRHTWICERAEELRYHSKMITADRAVNDYMPFNDYMPLHVFELLVDARNGCERAVKNSKRG